MGDQIYSNKDNRDIGFIACIRRVLFTLEYSEWRIRRGGYKDKDSYINDLIRQYNDIILFI